MCLAFNDAQRAAIIRDALDFYGPDAQLEKCAEELEELRYAIMKYMERPGIKNRVDLYEEMADVLIMIRALWEVFDKSNLQNAYDMKLLRLSHRLIIAKQERKKDETPKKQSKGTKTAG